MGHKELIFRLACFVFAWYIICVSGKKNGWKIIDMPLIHFFTILFLLLLSVR